jgi:hypothetical protein
MSDALKKVQSGQKLQIPAQAYNAFIDAAVDYRRRTAHIGQKAEPTTRQTSIVLVRNDSGSNQNRLAVLGIDAPIIDPATNDNEFKNRVALSCVTPAVDTHGGKFVILAEPIAAGKIGQAYAAGVCPVQIDVEEDREYTSVDIADGETTSLAASDTGSATILWREGGTGVQWAVVRLGGGKAEQVMFGKPTSEWTGGSTMTLDPCDVAGTDNGRENATVHVLPGGYSMTNDTSVGTDQVVPYVRGDDGEYYVLGTPIEVVTTYRIDGANLKFQKKTRNVWVLVAGSESDWVDVHTGDECPEE